MGRFYDAILAALGNPDIKSVALKGTVPRFHTGGVVNGSGLKASEVPVILHPVCCHPYDRDALGLPQPEGRVFRPGQPPAVVVKIDVRGTDGYGFATNRVRKQLREMMRAMNLGRQLFGEELDD